MCGVRPRNRSLVWVTLYSVCFVCVLSFVFFEMLDVDGSDFEVTTFKTPTVPVRSGLRHSTTEDVQRAPLQQQAAIARLAITIDRPSVTAAALSVDRPHPTPAAVAIGHAFRVALPRASLETASSLKPQRA